MAFDFITFARDFQLPYMESGHHHCHQGWVQTHCPFCAGGASGWHLGINLESGNAHCWRCGAVPISQVLRALVPDTPVGELFRTYALSLRPLVKKTIVTHTTELTYPNDVGPLHQAHSDYLIRRQFDPDQIAKEWNIKGVGPLGGEWAWRLLIPICNSKGIEISYTSRAITDERIPRYLTLGNEESLEKPRSVLYGEQYAQEKIIVVEGPADVWRLGQGAVATLGTSWTEEQAARIRKYKVRFIMFDNERPAQRLAQKLAAAVASAPGTTEIITGLITDPGDLSVSEVVELRSELGL